MKEYMTPWHALLMLLMSPVCHSEQAISSPAPAMVGIDRSIENLAASRRCKPKKREAVIVIPERLVPGMRAKH